MALSHIRIENFKSIKRCDIDINSLNVLLGANGSGKTNILEALNYFYSNLTETHLREDIFDETNKYSNQVKIILTFDLSSFMKISRAHTDPYALLFEESSERSKYSSYYEAIINLAESSPTNTVTLRLTQIKGSGIKWSEPFDRRFVLKSLFPFFCVSTRDLDITEWSQVWDVLGELGKVSNEERHGIEEAIREIVDKSAETTNKIKGVKSVFRSSEVSVQAATSKKFATQLAKIYFAGETIYQKGKRLPFFSTGTNSIKYIELLLRGINEIARTKLKEPLIMFDEPELSLHPNYIDELAEAFLAVDSKTSIMISTHSSRLIKNLLQQTEDISLYNVSLDNNHSVIGHMRRFTQYKSVSKYRVVDDHINAYFSRAILFVEGETELEFFANPYLRELFPWLKSIDVYKAMSEKPILSIMHPEKTKSKTPYLCLIDMDKAIRFDCKTEKLGLKNEFFRGEKENFSFRSKKQPAPYLKHLRRRLIKMSEKLHVHYYKPFYSCKDKNFYDYIGAVRQYLLNYRVFAWETTIEGVLVNHQTFAFALDFQRKLQGDNYDSLEAYLNGLLKNDRLNVLRMLYKGKSDLLAEWKNIILSEADKKILDKIKQVDKASGWVSKFLDEFIQSLLPEGVDKTPKGMARCFKNSPEIEKEVKKQFAYYFSELYLLLSVVYDIIN